MSSENPAIKVTDSSSGQGPVITVDPSAPKADTALEEIMAKVSAAVDEPGETAAPEAEVVAAEPAPAVEEPKEDPRVAKQFAALARKEKQAREAQKAAERQAKDIERRMKEIEAKEAQFTERSSKKPASAMEALKAAGYSFSDVYLEQTGQKKDEGPVDPVKEEIGSLRSELSETKKQLDEALKNITDFQNGIRQKEAQNQEQAVRYSIEQTAKQNADKYEYIQLNGSEAYDNVYNVMIEHLRQHDEVLTYEAACDLVEAYYEETANKFKSAKKFSPPAATSAPKPPVSTKPASTIPAAKTVTQSARTANTSASPTVDGLPKDEALALLAKKLKYLD